MTNQMTTRGTILRVPRPAPGMRPGWGVSARARGRVVLALNGQDRPTQSLLYAVGLARALDARLHVLAVVPSRVGLHRLLSDDATLGRHALDKTRATREALNCWLEGMLDVNRAVEHVAVSLGDFVAQAAVYAATINAKLILVAADEGTPGRKVTALSMAAATPVLLIRAPWGRGTILAATDLLSAKYPVLVHAAELGRRLQGSVVAVHNVTPEPVAGAELALMGYVPRSHSLEKAHAERLAEVARRLPIAAQTVVRTEHSSVDAVLTEAKAHSADLVVVGTRRRGRLDRLCRGSASAKITSGAGCSVLVLPLDELESGGATA